MDLSQKINHGEYRLAITPKHFSLTWQNVLGYVVIGMSAAGVTYFLVRHYKRAKQNRHSTAKNTANLPHPLLGPDSQICDEKRRQKIDSKTESQPRVSQLCVYPIKSCRALLVDSFRCGEMGAELVTEHGIIRDRTWMVTTSKYAFVTQRMKPKMSLIVPSINGSKLEVNAPEMTTLRLPLCPDLNAYEKVESAVWGSKIAAVDLGDDAGTWFADYLNLPGARLIYHPHHFGGRDLTETNPVEYDIWKAGEKCAFADGAPYLLLGEESVNDFSTHLESPVTWKNFRPNILVSDGLPYEEDRWKDFAIGDAKFRNAKMCTRCVMTTVDPEKGSFDRKDVLQTLKKYRVNQSPEWSPVYENHPLIAINLGLIAAGTISVGDPIRQI